MTRYTRKSKRALERAAAKKLQRRVEQNIGTKQRVVTVQGAIDGVKMSEVLEDFVDPYMRFTTDLTSVKHLYVSALIAWNLALVPKAGRSQLLDRLLAELKLDPESSREMRAVVGEFVERKERFFSQYKRFIIDLEITDTGKDYHLSVVSSAEPIKPSA